MRLTEIREIAVPLTGDIANAVVNFSAHTISLVAVTSDVIRDGRPVTGLAFNSIGRYAQGGLMRERFIPRLLAAAPETLLDADGRCFDPAAVFRIAMRNEKPGGHGDRAAAVAAIELAIWDLNARLRDEPACVTIARATGRPRPTEPLPVYAAGGYYYPGDSIARLAAEIAGYRDAGFRDFKIKIGGAPLDEDLRRIEAILPLAGGGQHLAVDVNGRFDLEQALTYGKAIAPLGLRWYEEVGDPLDYGLNAALAREYAGAIATGENLFSSQDVLNLVRFGGMRPGLDIFQMEAGLSYGLTDYLKTVALLESHGFSRQQVLPHGGHLINLHIATALGLGGCEVYPGVFQPFGGYPDACMRPGGRAFPTDAAGFGLEQKAELRPWIERLGVQLPHGVAA
ncbi:MAG: enolase C-terminal domain-like protein [Lautropia sp.]